MISQNSAGVELSGRSNANTAKPGERQGEAERRRGGERQRGRERRRGGERQREGREAERQGEAERGERQREAGRRALQWPDGGRSGFDVGHFAGTAVEPHRRGGLDCPVDGACRSL
jgi:hypothetical protein